VIHHNVMPLKNYEGEFMTLIEFGFYTILISGFLSLQDHYNYCVNVSSVLKFIEFLYR
jgi:hypothetical protein